MLRVCIALSLLAGSLASAATWKPVDPAELADRKPKVEPGADAEALFWEVQLVDEFNRGVRSAVLSNYIRIKIYNNRGRNRVSTINIDVNPGSHVDEIDARTIHVDGTIVEVSRDAIKENETTTGTFRRRQKSFPIPAVEPGSIIEYRWRETRSSSLGYVRMDFQRDIPVRLVRYLIKPVTYVPGQDSTPQPGITQAPGRRVDPNLDADYRTARNMAGMAIQDFQCKRTPLVKRGEFFETSMENVPAFKDEPNMPPANQLRAWSLLYYHNTDEHTAAKYWDDYGKSQYNFYSQHIKVSKQVRAVAAEVTSGAESPEQKLAALSDFCRSKIRNLGTDAVTAEERTTAQKHTAVSKTPDDILKEGVGSSANIKYLFASLAAAAGFEARIARIADRREIYFDRNFANSYFLRFLVVAVKLPGGWRFYDPAATYVPHDLLAWHFEGVPALITDPKEPMFQLTPVSSVQQSIRQFDGKFKLSEEGTLEGDVTVTYAGHEGSVLKERSERQSPEQREQAFKDLILARLSAAEISNIQIENATEIEKPFTYRAHLRVPGYAQRTGKRLFFAPAVFEQNQTARFPVKDRKYPVVFPYAMTESDQYQFELPEGFELSDASIPAAIPLGDAGRYEVQGGVANARTLVYRRTFTLGKDGHLGFTASAYPAVKDVFDRIAQADAYSLTLAQKSSSKVQ